MAKVTDIEDHRRAWHTYAVVCGACGHEWQGVLHTDRMTGLECPKCGESMGAPHYVEVAARFLYNRNSAFENANLLDCNAMTQRIWRERAAELFGFLTRAGWRVSSDGYTGMKYASDDTPNRAPASGPVTEGGDRG